MMIFFDMLRFFYDILSSVWNIRTGERLHMLSGHTAAVRCVCYNGKYVVSGAYDHTIRVWLPDQERCVHTLEGHTNRVYSLVVRFNRENKKIDASFYESFHVFLLV
jgi:WD40 repeat protein